MFVCRTCSGQPEGVSYVRAAERGACACASLPLKPRCPKLGASTQNPIIRKLVFVPIQFLLDSQYSTGLVHRELRRFQPDPGSPLATELGIPQKGLQPRLLASWNS